MLIGGIDVGTTGSKLTVYNTNGEFVYNVYKEYNVTRAGDEQEVDAQMIFDTICELIKDAAQKNSELGAIGVTTFGETFAAVDKNGEVLLPAMLYTDRRGEAETEYLKEKLGEEKIQYICGVKPHCMFSLPKILWIKNNKPEIYEKVYKFLLIEDYIIYKLTGIAQIDYSLAARTLAFDIRNLCWSEEILAAAGVDAEKFATPVAAGTAAGNILPELKEKLGLEKDIVIVNGAHDQVAAAVGSGVFEVGEAVDGTGTVECVTPVFDKIPEDEKLYDGGYAVVPYVFEGKYVSYAVNFTCGATLKWFRDSFAKYEQLIAEKEGKNVYALLDDTCPQRPTDLLIMPHFQGAGTPYMDNGSKSVILGLSLEHTNLDVYRALMEGVTYVMEENLEYLKECGINPKTLYVTGGGASSPLWLQIKADIFGRKVTTLDAKEVGACGTCMLVAVGAGIYKDLYEAKKVFVKSKKEYLPNPKTSAIYAEKFKAYKEIYSSIRHIADKI